MAGKTYHQSDRVLDLFLGQTVSGAAATYVSLFTANPEGDNLAGTEWSIDRVQVHQSVHGTGPYWSGKVSEGNKRYIENVRTISWTLPGDYTADEVVTGIGIWDHVSSGNLLYWEPLSTNRTLAASEEIVFGTSALKVRED